MRPVIALALAGLLLLSGCASPKGLAKYVPADSDLDDLHLPAVDGAQKAYFQSYGMERNPGPADADQFFASDGTTAKSARGAIFLLDGGAQDDLVFVFAYKFASNSAAERYLDDIVCTEHRALLRDEATIVQVAWSSQSNVAAVQAAWNATVAMVDEDSAADRVC